MVIKVFLFVCAFTIGYSYNDSHRMKVLDRLVEEYEQKDLEDRIRQQNIKEHREWQQTPVLDWDTFWMSQGMFFIIIGVIILFFDLPFTTILMMYMIGFTLSFAIQTKPNF